MIILSQVLCTKPFLEHIAVLEICTVGSIGNIILENWVSLDIVKHYISAVVYSIYVCVFVEIAYISWMLKHLSIRP